MSSSTAFRLSELRSQKQKLSRQVRDKEEEVETSMQKLDALRQDIRRGEKLRRELESRCEQAEQEAARERRQRQRTEETGRAAAEELEMLRQRSSGPPPAPPETGAELQRWGWRRRWKQWGSGGWEFLCSMFAWRFSWHVKCACLRANWEGADKEKWID